MVTEALRNLKERELAYVQARATTTTIKEACEIAGIAPRTWDYWPRERRDHLNALAMDYKSSAVERALEALQDKVPELLEGLLGLAKQSRDKRLKLSAIKESLDRTLGRPKQRIEAEVSGRLRLIEEIVSASDGHDSGTAPPTTV